jgi:hypothetical protein
MSQRPVAPVEVYDQPTDAADLTISLIPIVSLPPGAVRGQNRPHGILSRIRRRLSR